MPSLRNSVATEFPNPVAPQNLVKILSIGIDADDDKVIDRVEDAGPNGGGMATAMVSQTVPRAMLHLFPYSK